MKYLLFSLFLCISTSVFAQNFTGVTQVNPDLAGSSERSPIIHLGRDGGVYVAWIKGSGTDGDAYITHSTDGGVTFVHPTRITTTGKINSSFQRTAQFVLDTKGMIHMVWMESRVNNQPDIWYSRSMDKGSTWSTPKSVIDANDSSKYAQDFASIAVDSSDNIYVSFLDSRETQRKTSMNVQIYMTKSTDGGSTWSMNKKANMMPNGIGGSCECCKQDIAVSPEGHVYIAFRSNINNARDIWVTRSMDAGATFDEAILIQSGKWNISACPVSGPNISLDGKEDLHAVWVDARDDSAGNSIAYYSRLPKGATQATPNKRLNRTNEFPKWPDVATTRDGSRIEAVYQVEQKEVQFVSSISDEAITLGTPVSATGKAQEFGRITMGADGTTYAVWQDYRRDGGDIYFAKYKPLSSVKNIVESTDVVNVYPNPVKNGELNLEINLKTETPVNSISVTSAIGQEIQKYNVSSLGRPSKKISLGLPKSLPPGKYFCTIIAGEKTLHCSFVIE